MNSQCFRCRRYTRHPLTVESTSAYGRKECAMTLCWDCHNTLIQDIEREGNDR